MRRVLFIAIAAIALGGCARGQYKDLPHPPITQEQDTPFIFKERYQTVDTELTTARINHQSDFVLIESTDEIVFWHPTSSIGNVTPSVIATIHSESVSSVKDDLADTTADTSNPDSVGESKPTTYAATPVVSTTQCKPVLCDGVVCGDVAVCGDQPCDPSLHDTYACTDDTCNLIVTHPSDIAKGDGQCAGFSQLDTCPIDTECKRQGRIARGVSNESE